jgi:hypothetical protein
MKNKLIDEMFAIELNAYLWGSTGDDLYNRRLASHKAKFFKLLERNDTREQLKEKL